MNYLPTVNLWNAGIHRALVSGQLKLQVGQWIQCGEGHKSRFVGIKNGVIDAVHWTGTAKNTRNKFLFRAHMHKLNGMHARGEINTVQFRDMAWAVSGTRNALKVAA